VTIIACVKVRDGLVLGTDSMSHISSGGRFLRSYENAHKLFQVGQLPMGVMTYGLGNVGPRSIESLMREFGDTLNAQRAVGTVADALFAFMEDQYDAWAATLPAEATPPELGFYMAGYSRNAVFADEREFVLPRDSKPLEPRKRDDVGATWRGVEFPFIRLGNGYALRVRQRLEEKGMQPAEIGAVLDDLGIEVQFDGMPVQDAIDYATFILKTTIGYSTFSMAVSPCGGPLQVAAILPDNGFEWLAKPELRVI